MTQQSKIQVADLVVSNDGPFTLFGGMNVLESRELALEVAAARAEGTRGRFEEGGRRRGARRGTEDGCESYGRR